MKFNNDFFYYFSLLGQLGFIFIANILLFIYLYKFYEKFFGSNSLIFFILLFLGLVSAFYNCYKLLMRK
jgi:F0F1-type ATP synthase assembly protein I